jgi:hypothetical protein
MPAWIPGIGILDSEAQFGHFRDSPQSESSVLISDPHLGHLYDTNGIIILEKAVENRIHI